MSDIRLINGDNLAGMRGEPDGSVGLCFTDPPYNIGIDYGVYHDSKDKYEFLNELNLRMHEVARLLRPGGSIYVVINDENAAEVKLMLDSKGLVMRNWVVWHYAFGPHQKKKWGRDHAHVLYFIKPGGEVTFNADAVRVRSARQEKYGDRRADSRGRVPGDVWQISRVCGTFKEREDHPCQLPLELVKRAVLASSGRGDLVLDPYSGSGTTAAACKELGRRFLGWELNPEYHANSLKRLKKITVGLVPEELLK